MVELALTSSERQTKVAACELLHSLVLYALGRGSQQHGSPATASQMAPLYRKLFPVVMQLSCDVEQVGVAQFDWLLHGKCRRSVCCTCCFTSGLCFTHVSLCWSLVCSGTRQFCEVKFHQSGQVLLLANWT